MQMLKVEKLLDESICLSKALMMVGSGIKNEECTETDSGPAVEYLSHKLKQKLQELHDIVVKGIE